MTVRKKRRSRSVTADMADGDLQGGEAAASILKGQLYQSRQHVRNPPVASRFVFLLKPMTPQQEQASRW